MHIKNPIWFLGTGMAVMLLGTVAMGCGASNSANPTTTASLDTSGWSPDMRVLHAVRQGDIASVKSLIEGDPNLANTYDETSGKSILHYAAEGENKELVQYLLEKGADPLVVDNEDRTPLQCAEEARSPNAIQGLLKEAMIKTNQQETPGSGS